ncbi:hypothetical protein EMIT0357P_20792 [Pseudomonas marginalis]
MSLRVLFILAVALIAADVLINLFYS